MNIESEKCELVTKLQKRVKIKKILYELKKFRQLDLDTKIKTSRYVDCIKLLCNKSLLSQTESLFNSIDRILNPNSKKNNSTKLFLSTYIIKHHSNEIFMNIPVQMKSNLKKIATVLINMIEHSLLENYYYRTFSLNFFGVLFNTYVINYKIMLELDKLNLIDELYREYYNLMMTKQYVQLGTKYDSEQKENIIKVLDNAIIDVQHSVKVLDKNFDLIRFDDVLKFEKQTKLNTDNNFWKTLHDEIDHNNYTNVLSLLENIKNVIYDLTTQSLKASIKTELDEYIDVQFIKQKLDHNVMNRYDILALCEYIFKHITNLQSLIRDSDTNIIWSDIEKSFKSSDSLGLCISKFFKEIFKIVDDIFCDVLLYPLFLNTNINHSNKI